MLTPSPVGAKRVFERLEALYGIGGGGGANRPAYTRAEDEAHELVAAWMTEARLRVEADPAGNLVGRAAGTRPDLPEVWTGSHVDSVPRGGRFDGALGVVAGLEAVGRVTSAAHERTLGVVVFRAEETGCHGSRARVASGALPGAYVEVHVEQGPALAAAGAPLGVVTTIAGIVRGERAFVGSAAHAGTTPMDARRDALVEAAAYVLRVREVAGAIDGAVATVGRLDVEPGAENVVPALARLRVDARAPDGERLERLRAELGLDPDYRVEPAPMAESVRAVLREEVDRLGLPVVELASGAGHDAGILASAGVDAGMLFVRSLAGGVSHCPEEESSEDDVALAVDVLAAALGRLAA
jgi:acetylornithine deacetylase/succinyl-diaminopimelate desuccinylase-like protein